MQVGYIEGGSQGGGRRRDRKRGMGEAMLHDQASGGVSRAQVQKRRNWRAEPIDLV